MEKRKKTKTAGERRQDVPTHYQVKRDKPGAKPRGLKFATFSEETAGASIGYGRRTGARGYAE